MAADNGPPRTTRTVARARQTFLAALAEAKTITDAAVSAGVGRATVYQWRDADPEFAGAWENALEMGADVLEREATRRAVEGVEEPVIGRVGKDEDGVITYVRKYSDGLLTTLLKAKRPAIYRERTSVDVAGSLKHDHGLDDGFAAIAAALGGHAAGSPSGAGDDGGMESGGAT